MKAACNLLSLFLLATGVCGAQTSATEQAFRNSLLKEQLVLRNYSNDKLIHASWTGEDVTFDKSGWHMLGVVQVNSVNVKSGRVTIEGNRKALESDEMGKLTLYPFSQLVEIIIDIPLAEIETVLPVLKYHVFFPTIEMAIANVPKKLQSGIPPPSRTVKKVSSLPKCDCAAAGTDTCTGAGWDAPKLLKTVDPEMSNEARNARTGGSVQTGISLDKSGVVDDVWIVKPAGLGLDEQAAKAIVQYKFKPASCHEIPVATGLFIDVNFRFP